MYEPYYLAIFATVLLISIFSDFSSSQESDLEKAEILDQQATKLLKQRRYAEAIPIAEKVLAIREKALGTEHFEVAESLISLANLHKSLRNYPEAESLYKRALAISEKTLGSEHPDVANVSQQPGRALPRPWRSPQGGANIILFVIPRLVKNRGKAR